MNVPSLPLTPAHEGNIFTVSNRIPHTRVGDLLVEGVYMICCHSLNSVCSLDGRDRYSQACDIRGDWRHIVGFQKDRYSRGNAQLSTVLWRGTL